MLRNGSLLGYFDGMPVPEHNSDVMHSNRLLQDELGHDKEKMRRLHDRDFSKVLADE